MSRVAVVGASGYAGAELVRILSGHPDVTLTVVTSRQYAGKPFDSVYPAFNGLVPLTFQDNDPDLICEAKRCRLSGIAPQSLHGDGTRIAGCRKKGGGSFRRFPV
jgi:N-acetyl-gamma-glutamylphosphate reductase